MELVSMQHLMKYLEVRIDGRGYFPQETIV